MLPNAVPKPERKPKVYKRLRATKPMRRVGKKGAAFPKRKNREFRRWLTQHKPCELQGRFTSRRVTPNDTPMGGRDDVIRSWWHVCWRPLDPAHVLKQSKGAGDVGQCVVLCRPAHRLYDSDYATWLRVTGLTQAELENRAGGHGLAWIERGGLTSTQQE